MIRYIKNAPIPSESQLVWRYMDLAKFQFILEREKLFFPTVALLRSEDPLEGSWANFAFAQSIGSSPENVRAILEYFTPIWAETAAQQLAVSCWHVNEQQSETMWKLYAPDGAGIAIQTTFGNLKDSFIFEHPDWPTCGGNFQQRKVELLIGQAEYIDWSTPPINTARIKQILFKSNCYQHENELRITALLFPLPSALHSMDEHGEPLDDESLGLSTAVLQQVKDFKGVFIPVDVNKLVGNIYIAPKSSSLFSEAVESLTVKYGLSAPIHKPTS